MKKVDLRSDCPINYALEYLGDKWTLLVIRDLVFEGKKFFKDFQNSQEGIATNILSDRLKRLEALGIVSSAIDKKQRRQKIYRLSPKGADLVPILVEIIIWSSKHKDGLNVNPVFLQKLSADKSGMIKAIQASIGSTQFSAHQ